MLCYLYLTMYAGRGIQANMAHEYKAGMFFSPIGETELMGDDGMGEKKAEFKGMTLMIEVADDAEAKRVFTALLINVRCRTDMPSPFTQQSSCWRERVRVRVGSFRAPGAALAGRNFRCCRAKLLNSSALQLT